MGAGQEGRREVVWSRRGRNEKGGENIMERIEAKPTERMTYGLRNWHIQLDDYRMFMLQRYLHCKL